MVETADAAASTLRRYLALAAERRIDVTALAARWRMARINLRCAGGGGAAANPNTPAKLRGAWGRQLADGASAEALEGGPCPWPAPCAYDVLLNPQGSLTARLEIPRPYVLAVADDSGDLTVRLTLFGVAAEWAGEAADALVRALRGGLDMAGDRRMVFAPVSRSIETSFGDVAPPPAGAALRLSFITPLALRQGEVTHADPASLIKSLANRISGLALWHGAALAVDGPTLAAEAACLGAGARWEAAAGTAWRRGSRAQGRQIRLGGVIGVVTLPPASPFVATLVALGAHAHAGGRATLGLGRYRLEAVAL